MEGGDRMCNFCEAYDINEASLCTKLVEDNISVGKLKNICILEMWMLKESNSDSARLEADICRTIGGDNIAEIKIPIKYCPMCGRKL